MGRDSIGALLGWRVREMRNAIGIAVFFGMLGVTIFGLILTPVFYVGAGAPPPAANGFCRQNTAMCRISAESPMRASS